MRIPRATSSSGRLVARDVVVTLSIAVVVLGAVAPSFAQTRYHGNPLLESHRLLRLARELAVKSFSQAIDLLDEADASLDDFEPTTDEERNIIAVVRSDTKALRADIRRRDDQARSFRSEIRQLARERRFSTVVKRLDDAPAYIPTDDADFPFARIRAEARQAVQETERLIGEARAHESSNRRRLARETYRQAGATNADVDVSDDLERLKVEFHFPRRLQIRANAAYQPYAQSFSSEYAFPLYGETGELSTQYRLHPSSDMAGTELGASIRLGHRFGIGVTRSRSETTYDADIVGSLPHPTRRVTPRTLTGSALGFERVEEAYHLEVSATSIRDRLQTTIFAGPSLFRVRQSLVSGIRFAEGGLPTLTGDDRRDATTATTVGLNAGIDVSFMFVRALGLGITVRGSGAQIAWREAAAPEDARKIVMAGVQVTGGVRARF